MNFEPASDGRKLLFHWAIGNHYYADIKVALYAEPNYTPEEIQVKAVARLLSSSLDILHLHRKRD